MYPVFIAAGTRNSVRIKLPGKVKKEKKPYCPINGMNSLEHVITEAIKSRATSVHIIGQSAK